MATKQGRPRRYDLRPLPDFADPEVSLAAAALDELRARVVDQIADLSDAALACVPEGLVFSMSALVAHMVWAEMNWIRGATGVDGPQEMHALLDPIGRALPAGTPVAPELGAAELAALCTRLRDEQTLPALAAVADIDAEVPEPARPTTVRGILMHLIWHWTYHSGQIGLMRDLCGAEGYVWALGAMGKNVGTLER